MNRNTILLDSISTGIFIINSEYKVTYWNSYLEDWTNVYAEDIIGKDLSDFFPKFKDDILKTHIHSVFEFSSPIILSSTLHSGLLTPVNCTTSEKNVFEITITGFPNENLPDRFLALFTVENVSGLKQKIESLNKLNSELNSEIRQRKETENSLSKSQELLIQSNNDKDKFISIMAHDLMGSMGNTIELLRLLRTEKFEPEQKDTYFSLLEDNARATYKLLTDLITWGKATIGKEKFVPTKILLYEAFEATKKLYQSQTIQKNINLKVTCPKHLVLYADPDMLHVILRNIVKNAIKYTKRGGNILLTVERDSINITICVSDTGRGMSGEKTEKLFSIDNIQSEPGTEGEMGSGLGLQIVKEYISIHGGKISAESIPDCGTKIFVSFPNELSTIP